MHTYSSVTKKKKKDTEGTRAIKNLQKPMYAPQLYYGHKNICDKDGGICTHWPLKVINKTKTKRQKKNLKHVELRWTCFVAEPSQSYTYMLCKYIASTNDHEVCSNIKEAMCATQKYQTASKLGGRLRADPHFSWRCFGTETRAFQDGIKDIKDGLPIRCLWAQNKFLHQFLHLERAKSTSAQQSHRTGLLFS